MTLVDYGLLHASTKHYERRGFKRIEAPWLVSSEISDLTRPKVVAQYVVHKEGGNVLGDGKQKAFVASGEQSFLYMMAKGYLPKGSYQTITPCIRNEMFDETHVKYFIKNELIITDFTPATKESALNDIMAAAMAFFRSCVIDPAEVVHVDTDIGVDIEYHNIEIGSYGYRESMVGNWIYGTGLAEPRFSRLVDSLGTRRD